MTSLSTRRQGALRFAELLAAQDLIIFDYDEEVDRFLPSLGFAQTIRGGKDWQEFLKLCSLHGTTQGNLPFPPLHTVVPVTAVLFDDLIWAFAGSALNTDGKLDDWRDFDIVLAKMLKSERSVLKQESQNQILRELTHELRSYASALNTAKHDLNKALKETEEARILAEQANATKSAFLANMSHEIRTPLSAILGFNCLLKDPQLSGHDRDLFIDTIERNGKALTHIIDDILDLAKVEAGKLEIEYVDFSLYDLLHDTLDLFGDVAVQKHIDLTLRYDQSAPRSIVSDPARLRQVFINIIGNAVKFTAQGAVQISVSGMIEGPSPDTYTFYVEVKDSGPGLSLEQKERLFQPFVQGDNSVTRKFGGTGLGLVLSKRLTEALSGTIEITQHALGEGSTFVVSFPAKYSTQSKIRQKSRSNAQSLGLLKGKLDNLNVLLVDDSIDNLLLAKRLLVRSGAQVDTANDGIEALNKAESGSYDIILMDIQMPRMDGYEAMGILRSKGCQIPILALTAHAMLEEKQKSLAAGFNGHLTKPLNFDELVQSIEHHAVSQSAGQFNEGVYPQT